ncbi:hypothetical protein BDV26DRAFT_266796 [Aspergillus bertholletiae]|uniref:Uncharacterized protein n=1 Tax=Aspergillus bertholletiae TaxID=1226010 RepID=A0A5N7B2Q9_9EURO|nr:hypothetical protein BDV26DRAFT_266796 [Aspergillus bertholletiae]
MPYVHSWLLFYFIALGQCVTGSVLDKKSLLSTTEIKQIRTVSWSLHPGQGSACQYAMKERCVRSREENRIKETQILAIGIWPTAIAWIIGCFATPAPELQTSYWK